MEIIWTRQSLLSETSSPSSGGALLVDAPATSAPPLLTDDSIATMDGERNNNAAFAPTDPAASFLSDEGEKASSFPRRCLLAAFLPLNPRTLFESS